MQRGFQKRKIMLLSFKVIPQTAEEYNFFFPLSFALLGMQHDRNIEIFMGKVVAMMTENFLLTVFAGELSISEKCSNPGSFWNNRCLDK